MSDNLEKDLLPRHGEAIDPVAMARRDQVKMLPKRFYKKAEISETGSGLTLLLDGRPAKTPARNPFAFPNSKLGEAVAAEWQAQKDTIDPAVMPLTRIANSAIDAVARQMNEVRADIAKYAGSDLVCYRAGDPQNLVAAQAQAWDPVLDFAREKLGARFILSEGIVFTNQPESALEAIRARLKDVTSPFTLAGLHVMTTLMGSALLALAVLLEHMDAKTAWTSAHVDEDFQMQKWGMDADALARRARRWDEMQAAALFCELGA